MTATSKTIGLQKAREKLDQMRAEGIEVARLTPTEKALADPGSRHKAIRAACYECLGGSDCPNVRHEIAYCTGWDCALWHLRPHQQHCADPSLWPHKHLKRANYGEPFGLDKRQAALAKANTKDHAGRQLVSAAKQGGSLKTAIRARCVQCVGGRKADITNCAARFHAPLPGKTYVGCPLYPVRPYQSGEDEPDTDTETEFELEADPGEDSQSVR